MFLTFDFKKIKYCYRPSGVLESASTDSQKQIGTFSRILQAAD